jgi:hypothetical protein
MATSSILGSEMAASIPDGKDSEALGPSDRSDSGSDSIGVAKNESRKPPAGARRPADLREYAAEEERSRDA